MFDGNPVILLGMFDEYYAELDKLSAHDTKWDYSFLHELNTREDLQT
jgi:hypothetical protein